MFLRSIWQNKQFLRIKPGLILSPLKQSKPCTFILFSTSKSTAVSNPPVLRLFAKAEGCSLCDNAKAELMKLHHMFVLEEVDITAEGNELWYELYKYDIPVIHVNNREVLRHYVDEKVLLEALVIASEKNE